ncbi:DNA-methyltransferase [Nocardioides bruguierae]|uniref:Methyltransferase n=1 Tax=Nocardioides bruguierae TaxID=2945102 RepID=A0A9X2D7K9_9ACTN|nr:site-specific DNA-methyltransferase [Nocardioides bruguierae]MCM0620509.1 site-specific DNA-methyltransferase [Nocardioides bruguierae]
MSAPAEPLPAPREVHRTGESALFEGDSIAWLRTLPDSSVDLVFADPPYNIKKAAWDSFESAEAYISWSMEWMVEASRVLTPTGSLYVCGFPEVLADLKHPAMRHFHSVRWLVWHYRNKANLGSDWGRSHEAILHFRKSRATRIDQDPVRIPYGAHTLKYPGRAQAETSAFSQGREQRAEAWQPHPLGAKPKDVIEVPTTCNGMGEKTPHPTQKPEELVRKFVLASSPAGGLVLDPFSGSGTTAVVAEQLGRRWLACELEPEYNAWAVQRLENVQRRTEQEWIEHDRAAARRRASIR